MGNANRANPARRHHVIPQLYLAGFTNSGEKNGLLYAHDLRETLTRIATALETIARSIEQDARAEQSA